MNNLSHFFRDFVDDAEEKSDTNRNDEETVSSHGPTKTYDDWKSRRNESLQDFIDARLQAKTDKSASTVPHIDETVFDVTNIEKIDLFSRSVKLNLVQATHLFKLRLLRRDSVRRAAGDPAATIGSCNDDGPLCTVYRNVVYMEVEQILTEKESQLSRLAAAAIHQQRPKYQRLKIFFYNPWAEKIEEILRRWDFKASSTIVLSLQVPAKCIFPTPMFSDWFDNQCLLPYCICVGGKSQIMSEDLEIPENKEHIRFDQPVDTIISLGRTMERNGTVTVNQAFSLTVGSAGEVTVEQQDNDDIHSLNGYLSVSQNRDNSLRVVEEGKAQNETVLNGSDEESMSVSEVSPQPPAPQFREKHGYTTLAELPGIWAKHNSERNPVNGDPVAWRSAKKCLIDLYGVVLGFGCPTRTKTGDWTVSIALVDPSLTPGTPDLDNFSVHRINLNIFSKSKDDMPHIERAGDVIRAHRLIAQEFQDDIQLVSRRGSSFVVLRPNQDGAGYISIPTAQKTFNMEDGEEDRFIELWKWGQNRLASMPTMEKTYACQLAEVCQHEERQEELYSLKDKDITVLVSSMFPYPESLRNSATPQGYLRVWDGTGVPKSDQLPVDSQAARDAISNGDPPVEVLTELAKLVDRIKMSRDEKEIDVVKALSGRVCNVVVWEPAHWKLLEKVRVGSFIRLRNVMDEDLLDQNIRCLSVHSKSYITPLPDISYEALEILRDHSKRIRMNEPINSNSGILPLHTVPTEVDKPRARDNVVGVAVNPMRMETVTPVFGCRSTTLARLVRAPLHTKAVCAVRIIGTYPPASELADRGINHATKEYSDGSITYRFGVALQDSTSQIDAIVAENSTIGETLTSVSPGKVRDHPERALASLQRVFDESALWEAVLQAVEFREEKFFLLLSLKKA